MSHSSNASDSCETSRVRSEPATSSVPRNTRSQLAADEVNPPINRIAIDAASRLQQTASTMQTSLPSKYSEGNVNSIQGYDLQMRLTTEVLHKHEECCRNNFEDWLLGARDCWSLENTTPRLKGSPGLNGFPMTCLTPKGATSSTTPMALHNTSSAGSSQSLDTPFSQTYIDEFITASTYSEAPLSLPSGLGLHDIPSSLESHDAYPEQEIPNEDLPDLPIGLTIYKGIGAQFCTVDFTEDLIVE